MKRELSKKPSITTSIEKKVDKFDVGLQVGAPVLKNPDVEVLSENDPDMFEKVVSSPHSRVSGSTPHNGPAMPR